MQPHSKSNFWSVKIESFIPILNLLCNINLSTTLPLMEIVDQLQATRISEDSPTDIVGTIRINPRSYQDAFISDPEGGSDIYIEGSKSRGATLEGDLVSVRLNPKDKWKVNFNAIANRWDEWASHILPIIENIESDDSEAVSVQDVSTSSKSRKKRSLNSAGTPDTTPKKDDRARLLPSNLPSRLSKLKVEHVLSLPFFLQCAQKTGFVIKIIRRDHSGLAGGFLKKYSESHALFSPTDSRIPRMLVDINQCPLDFATKANRYADVLFVAQLNEWVPEEKFASGNLIRIIGDSSSIQSRIETILIENQIYDQDFPKEAYDELTYLNDLPVDWFVKNSVGRRDLTDECIFTIDPKTARDLDDALSIKKLDDHTYEVGVHIADVSYFVEEMTAVDYQARLRTTSVYLVDRVIPMLPRILCEKVCSLNPGEPKFTFSVIWRLDKDGRILDEWFGRTIIKSCVKLAYEEAQDIIDNPGDLSWIKEGKNVPKLHGFDWNQIAQSVIHLNTIALNLRAKRFESGALRIEQVKLKYELDVETGYPTGFTFESRTDSNHLVEEFMLLANMEVAKRIYKHSDELAFLRRHPASCPKMLEEVREFCNAKGYKLDVSNAGSIQKSLNKITDQTTLKVVSFLLLRTMKNAAYICTGALSKSDDSYRHYALNVPFYTHFTSPIRRYPDIIVHRQLSIALGLLEGTNEDKETLRMMAEECNKRKMSSKLISETSQKLYFNLFVQRAGSCELLACVTKIQDQSLDVILVDYDYTGRVHMNNVMNMLHDFKFQSFSGIRKLVIRWKPTTKAAKRRADKMRKRVDGSEFRSSLENRQENLKVNESSTFHEQIIQVFDVIRVIVTTNEKDISKLNIDLKIPIE